MKIRKINISGLNKNIEISHDFHEDINIVTGLNGAGKTTLLKVIWYLISSNAERIAPEIEFNYIELVTDFYRVILDKQPSYIEWTFEDFQTGKITNKKYKDFEDPTPRSSIEELNQMTRDFRTSSLYFPTFRRIEGGYSMTPIRRTSRSGRLVYRDIYRFDNIQDELASLADRISVDRHKFICSISTNDIVSLLTRRYAHISESLNTQYKSISTYIINQIQDAKPKMKDSGSSEALSLLNRIQERADTMNEERDKLLHPFTILSELTDKLFKHRGIRLQAVTLGDSADAIDSSILSAGEKQLLSFLCYNAFSENSIVFIDEPELSLHPDWQRRLFSILIEQQPTNQFIVATHSPFIYTKYSDKEIPMLEDKGA
ncbi:AAA family ATPase [Allofranklinella schreckenbergeri]|nr:ATP-binding protein [Allofranklinella schreckenbergeri]